MALSGGLELLGAAGGPRLLGAEIRALEIDWGQGRVRGSGQIEIDRAGRPQGRIALTVQNWRPVLKSLVGAGALRPETAPTWERGLAQLAAAQGDGATVSLPLVFRQGWMSLGPIPIGPAPVF